MQDYTRVLLKIKVEEDSLPPWLCTFGSEPKICTGYRDDSNTFYIPIDTLIKQNFSLSEEIIDSDLPAVIEGKKCLWFFPNEVEVLVN